MCYTQELCDTLSRQLPGGWYREQYISYQVKRRFEYYVPIIVVAFSWNGKRFYKSFHVKKHGGIIPAFVEALMYRDQLVQVLQETSPRQYNLHQTTGRFGRKKTSRTIQTIA